MARTLTHEIVDGFCRVCGDTAEWLQGSGAEVVIVVEESSVLSVGE